MCIILFLKMPCLLLAHHDSVYREGSCALPVLSLFLLQHCFFFSLDLLPFASSKTSMYHLVSFYTPDPVAVICIVPLLVLYSKTCMPPSAVSAELFFTVSARD